MANISLNFTMEGFQNGTTSILATQPTDAELIAQFCTDFGNYQVIMYAIPVALVFLRYGAMFINKKLFPLALMYPRFYGWVVSDAVVDLLFLINFVNLMTWIFA